jgi:hypothetical protein
MQKKKKNCGIILKMLERLKPGRSYPIPWYRYWQRSLKKFLWDELLTEGCTRYTTFFSYVLSGRLLDTQNSRISGQYLYHKQIISYVCIKQCCGSGIRCFLPPGSGDEVLTDTGSGPFLVKFSYIIFRILFYLYVR